MAPETSPELCCSALRALKALIASSGLSFSPSLLKDVQVCLVGLSLDVQQRQTCFDATAFQDPSCRLALMDALLQLCLLPHPKWPAPVHFGVQIFRRGRCDESRAVSALCSEASSALEAIVHPRSASLNVDSLMSASEVKEVKEKLLAVHTLVLAGAGGDGQVEGESDGLFKQTASEKETEEAGENNDVMADVEPMEQESAEATAENDGDEAEEPPAKKKVEAVKPKAREDDKSAAIPESDMSKEEKENIMKKFYNFDSEPVFIPDSVKVLEDKKEKKKGGREDSEKSVSAEKEEEEEKQKVDVDQIFSKFVAESSDEEDE